MRSLLFVVVAAISATTVSSSSPYTMPGSPEWPTSWVSAGTVLNVTLETWQNECWAKFQQAGFGITNGLMSSVNPPSLSQYDLTAAPLGLCNDFMSCAYRYCGNEVTWSYPEVNQATTDFLNNPLSDAGVPFNLPAKVSFPNSVEDIIPIVTFAAQHNIAISIKATGHSYTGSSASNGSIMVNMREYPHYTALTNNPVLECSSLTSASDQNEQTVCAYANLRGKQAAYRVATSQTWNEAYANLSQYNLRKGTNYITVGGAAGSVGAAGGWMQGGGLSGTGGSMRMFGLGCDQVLQIEMVLADATHVRFGYNVSALNVTGQCNTNPVANESQWQWVQCVRDFDSLWFAVRGGGGGTYGIVTSVYYQLSQQPGSVNNVQIGQFTAISAMNQTIVAATPTQAIDTFKDDIDTFYLNFLIDFLWNSSAVGVSSELSNRCNSGDMTMSLMKNAVPPALWCFGEESVTALQTAWAQYLQASNIAKTASSNLQTNGGAQMASYLNTSGWFQQTLSNVFVPLSLVSYIEAPGGMESYSRAMEPLFGPNYTNTTSWNRDYYTFGLNWGVFARQDATPGRVPDLPSPSALPDSFSRGFDADVPLSWVLNKTASIPVLVQLTTLGSGMGGIYLLGGVIPALGDGTTAQSHGVRNTAMYLSAYFGSSGEDLLRTALYGNTTRGADEDYPGDVEFNHHSPFEWGPLKDNWGQGCPRDWTQALKAQKCVSLQEAVWGTKNLAKLTAIKKSVDPTSMFNCYHGVGYQDVFVDAAPAPPTPPTPTPYTPSLPAGVPAVSVITSLAQTVTYSISTSQYVGAVKEAYDNGYASYLGIYQSSSNSLIAGCSLTGTASPTRRGSVISYAAVIISSLSAAAIANANSNNAQAGIQAAINAVIASAYSNQNIPSALVQAVSPAIVSISVDASSVTAGYSAMTQVVSFVTTVAYSTSTPTRDAYDKGYGSFLGIYSTGVGYTTGTGVQGYQTSSTRRAGTSLTYLSVLKCAAYASASNAAAGKSTADLQSAIQNVINSEHSILGIAATPSSLGGPSQAGFCSSGNSSGLSGGAIAGIVIGSVLGFLLLIIIIYFLVCRKPADGNPSDGKPSDFKTNTHSSALEATQQESNNKVVDDKTVKI